MKFVRYQDGSSAAWGIIEGDSVTPVLGDPFTGWTRTNRTVAPWDLHVLPPASPTKVICVGLNYKLHAEESGMEVPKEPMLFLKPPTAVIGPEEGVVYSHLTTQLDYECELAIVIGKTAHRVSVDDAPGVVAGYTCANDVSARDLQRADGQWARAKGMDTFCPLGPVLVNEIDPVGLWIQTKLNGEVKQDSNTADMVFKPDFIVHYVSQAFTLFPGDVIITGTPSGIGPMQVGDRVEVIIQGIGTLSNPIVAPE